MKPLRRGIKSGLNPKLSSRSGPKPGPGVQCLEAGWIHAMHQRWAVCTGANISPAAPGVVERITEQARYKALRARHIEEKIAAAAAHTLSELARTPPWKEQDTIEVAAMAIRAIGSRNGFSIGDSPERTAKLFKEARKGRITEGGIAGYFEEMIRSERQSVREQSPTQSRTSQWEQTIESMN